MLTLIVTIYVYKLYILIYLINMVEIMIAYHIDWKLYDRYSVIFLILVSAGDALHTVDSQFQCLCLVGIPNVTCSLLVSQTQQVNAIYPAPHGDRFLTSWLSTPLCIGRWLGSMSICQLRVVLPDMWIVQYLRRDVSARGCNWDRLLWIMFHANTTW